MKQYSEEDRKPKEAADSPLINQSKDAMETPSDAPKLSSWIRSGIVNTFKFMAMTNATALKKVPNLSADRLCAEVKKHGMALLIHHGLSRDKDRGYEKTYHAVIVMDVLEVNDVGRIVILFDCQGTGNRAPSLEALKALPEELKSSGSLSEMLDKIGEYQSFLRAKTVDSIFERGDGIYQEDVRQHEETYGEINRSLDIPLMPAPHPPMLLVPEQSDGRFKTSEEKLQKLKMAFEENDEERSQIED